MNSFRARLDAIGISLGRLRPKSNPLESPTIIEFVSELNPHAPPDTPRGRGRPSRFAFLPDNYEGPALPPDVKSFDEWLAERTED